MTRSISFKHLLLIAVLLAFPQSSLRAQASDTVGTEEKLVIVDERDDDSDGTEDEEKDYYFIYKGYGTEMPPPDRRKVPVEKLDQMRKGKGMWYVNVEPEKPREPGKTEKRGNYTPLTERTWFQTLLWVLIIGGFGTFLAIYLTGDRVGLFRRAARGVGAGLPDTMPEDIFAIHYDQEIEKAERNRNYRAAVRLHFLKTLKNFADSGIISYNEGKTNFDYLVELHPTAYYEKFFRVTRAYEFTWYGKFPLEETAYGQVRQDFDNLNRMIH